MKRIIYFATAVFGMSLLLESCNGNSWMEGYWVNENSSVYLYVNGDKVYKASPTFKRKKTLDFNGAKELFEKQNFELWEIFEIGYAINLGDTEDGLGILKRNKIGVKDVDKIKSINEYIDESTWKEITSSLNCSEYVDLFDEPKIVETHSYDYKFLCSVSEGVDEAIILCKSKEKSLSFVEYDTDYYELRCFYTFTKIEPTGKEKELSPEEKMLSEWGDLFDDNNIAVFDIGLTSTNQNIWVDHFYLFFHAYSYSEGMTEGTATLFKYRTYIQHPTNTMGSDMRLNYVFKDGTVILTGAEWYSPVYDKWYKLNKHEMPFTFNATEHSLSGRYWFRDDTSYMITAKPIDFDYSYWINRVRF